MLRAMSWTLHQRRYRAIAAFMAVLAVVFVGIGTFELHRLHEKQHDNGVLRTNAHAAVAPLSTALVPLVGAGPGPAVDAIRYRRVGLTGQYDAGAEQYVGNKTQGGRQGFLVLTPLHTTGGTMLVARGFVAATDDQQRPATVPPPPGGTVRVVATLYPAETASDQDGRLGHDEITSVNPTQQAARLHTPVFHAYAVLTKGQPGTTGLTLLSAPDLSNPTGGAGELQLLSYVIQWYVFAVLALFAPFLFARAETREAQRRYLGVDPDAGEFDLEAAARAERPALAGGSGGATAVALQARAELAVRDSPVVQRAERLADRYGRSLGPLADLPRIPEAGPVRRAFVPPHERTAERSGPFRSDDAYHGAYNDNLWQLALAAGEVPDVALPADPPAHPDPAPRAVRVVDAVSIDAVPIDAAPEPDDAG